MPLDIIGNTITSNKMKERRINANTIKNSNIIHFNQDFNRACVLPNGTIGFYSYRSNAISVYDSNLNSLFNRELPHRSSRSRIFRIEDMVTNGCDKAYIAANDIDKTVEHDWHRVSIIYMTDLEINIIKKISSKEIPCNRRPRHLSQKSSFERLQFYKDHLYVLDELKARIIKLTHDMLFENEILLDYTPNSILISNDLVMIVNIEDRADNGMIYFYSFNDFQIKYKYCSTNMIGNTFVHNGYFYAFEPYNWDVYCFDKNGLFIEIVDFNFTQHLKETAEHYDDGSYYDNLRNTLNISIGPELLVYKL